jgi:hypothetical protein
MAFKRKSLFFITFSTDKKNAATAIVTAFVKDRKNIIS